jgi:outer membrane protein OmpA-like peptidoglycan-associated protein
MRPILISSILLLTVSIAFAQEVQWASEVLDFSTQFSEYQYSATQVLGKPDVLPDYGDNPNAWMPSKPDRLSFIKVGFERPMLVQQIAIGESYNPGAVYKVFLYDENDNEYLLNTFMPRKINVGGRMLNIYLSETEYAVSAVRIVLDGSSVPGYNGIDAIGISGTNIPIVAIRDMAFRRNPNLDNDLLNLGAEEGVSDSRPVFYAGNNTLFFTRSNSSQNSGGPDDIGDIWRSVFNPSTGEFTDITSIEEPINNSGYNNIQDIFEVNGILKVLVGNVSGTNKVTTNIAAMTITENGWMDFEEMKIKNARIGSFDADYTISLMDSILVVATIRYDTEGGRDLYIIRQEKDGKWGEPENMGGNINTTFDEYAPFYSKSEKSLYFASAGYPGFGGNDIFRITRLDDTWKKWSTPENIGMDINSEMDEIYFYFDDSDEYAYFARMNTDSIFGIVRVERPVFLLKTPMVALRGNVLSKETNQPVNSAISLMILPEEYSFGQTISDQTSGAYEILLPSGNEFKIISEKEGYEIYEHTFVLENRETEYTYDLDINLGRVVPEVMIAEVDEIPEEQEVIDSKDVIEINDGVLSINIEFGFDSDVIGEDFNPHLDEIFSLLNNTPVMIMLAGHTDNTGPDSYNQHLSERRAASVHKYFVEKGIDPNKLKIRGYGSSKPITSNATKEGRRRNRRVEFIRMDQINQNDK